jgi:membrane glycosyltransferase
MQMGAVVFPIDAAAPAAPVLPPPASGPAALTPGLAMPDQDFSAPFHDTAAPGLAGSAAPRVSRGLVVGVPLAVAAGLGWTGLSWFGVDGGLGVTEVAVILVSALAFYWVAQSCAVAALGLFWRPRVHAVAPAGLEIAILLPMYGEPPATTMGQAVALLAALKQAAGIGYGRHRFSLHILSDTRDPAAARIEAETAERLSCGQPGLTIAYRRRRVNRDFKSGNVRDWVATRGAGHDAMLILDADSVMSPQSVLRMADALACDPGTALIQSVPRVLPGGTLWQRMQSFAATVYGVNLGRGFAMWTGGEGNFLGHNALVRTGAFASCAGLPHLPGRAPLGGVILSHDFVEAALLRRAGWAVRMLPEATGSFEDTPPNLVGHLRRDRRWCQGNMQHLRLLAMPGLHPVSRFHLLQGAMAYLASVWWMALLILWAVTGPGDKVAAVFSPDMFGAVPFTLDVPALPPVQRGAVTLIVGLMLIGPRLMGLLAHLRDHRPTLRQVPVFAASVVVEMAVSMLVAPILMLHQVRAVLRTLAGFDGGWMPHVAGRPSLRTLARFHATETLLGAVLLGLAVAGQLTPWLLPVAGSLALAIPLSIMVQCELGPSRLLCPIGEP